jgi:hypothetical protein
MLQLAQKPEGQKSYALSSLANFQGELLADYAEGRFQLIQAGSVAQVEQPVHLGKMAVQAAAQLILTPCR